MPNIFASEVASLIGEHPFASREESFLRLLVRCEGRKGRSRRIQVGQRRTSLLREVEATILSEYTPVFHKRSGNFVACSRNCAKGIANEGHALRVLEETFGNPGPEDERPRLRFTNSRLLQIPLFVDMHDPELATAQSAWEFEDFFRLQCWRVVGKVDGVLSGRIVEVKTRITEINDGPPRLFERIQCECYMRMTNIESCIFRQHREVDSSSVPETCTDILVSNDVLWYEKIVPRLQGIAMLVTALRRDPAKVLDAEVLLGILKERRGRARAVLRQFITNHFHLPSLPREDWESDYVPQRRTAASQMTRTKSARPNRKSVVQTVLRSLKNTNLKARTLSQRRFRKEVHRIIRYKVVAEKKRHGVYFLVEWRGKHAQHRFSWLSSNSPWVDAGFIREQLLS